MRADEDKAHLAFKKPEGDLGDKDGSTVQQHAPQPALPHVVNANQSMFLNNPQPYAQHYQALQQFPNYLGMRPPFPPLYHPQFIIPGGFSPYVMSTPYEMQPPAMHTDQMMPKIEPAPRPPTVPTVRVPHPQVLKKPPRKMVMHDDERGRMLSAAAAPIQAPHATPPVSTPGTLPSAFKPSPPVHAPANVPAAPRRQVLPPPPPAIKRPAITSIYYGCHEKGDAFIKKGVICIPGHCERPTDVRGRDRVRPTIDEVLGTDVKLRPRFQPEKSVRIKSFVKHLHDALDDESALRERLSLLQKELRKLVGATADGDRKSSSEIDKFLELCLTHNRDQVRHLKGGQKEMDRLAGHGERIATMVSEYEKEHNEDSEADEPVLNGKRSRLD